MTFLTQKEMCYFTKLQCLVIRYQKKTFGTIKLRLQELQNALPYLSIRWLTVHKSKPEILNYSKTCLGSQCSKITRCTEVNEGNQCKRKSLMSMATICEAYSTQTIKDYNIFSLLMPYQWPFPDSGDKCRGLLR